MITSDFVKINKKKIIDKLIKTEAENVALKKKLKIYEAIVKTHIQKKELHEKDFVCHNKHDSLHEPVSLTEISTYPVEYKKDAETLLMKKKIYAYLKNPEQCSHIITPLVNQLLTKNTVKNINEYNIKKFLNEF